MPIVDEVIEFMKNDLNIKISNKKEELINNKFYPDIKNKVYWSHYVEDTLYHGIVSKKDYEKIKTLPDDTHIHLASIAKYINDECELKDIMPFTDDTNKIKLFYDRGGVNNNNNYFDLMNYFYEYEKLNYEE